MVLIGAVPKVPIGDLEQKHGSYYAGDPPAHFIMLPYFCFIHDFQPFIGEQRTIAIVDHGTREARIAHLTLLEDCPTRALSLLINPS